MTFELNKFADRTEDEFRNTILMRPQAPPIHPPSRLFQAIDIFARFVFSVIDIWKYPMSEIFLIHSIGAIIML